MLKNGPWSPDLYLNSIYCGYFGSKLHGTMTEGSDIDLYLIYVPNEHYVFPKDIIYGYDRIPEPKNHQYEKVDHEGNLYDVKFTSIISFLKQLEDGSTNALEQLFSSKDNIVFADQFGLSIRQTKSVYTTKSAIIKFLGTSMSHWKSFIKTSEPKQASESIRLLLDCIDYLSGTYKRQHKIVADIKQGTKTEGLEELRNALELNVRILEKNCIFPETYNPKTSRMILKDLLVNYYMDK